ncbi:hypothetical protein G7070_12240 [Propioniciclava coleopterorum]|uniref:Tat (Twin-arginine translocation) pathway signal sequence n=1 Tax=Propioniciclava coleopterorum TaxID=2714937 RepID=A0A6G7Y7V1_9ACTN|nr:hypothetical protein [Propioniciclava coleopterorum]QIK72895.1 hypothetical protein G7070_12240 [Propioniciclava coleopterorum]
MSTDVTPAPQAPQDQEPTKGGISRRAVIGTTAGVAGTAAVVGMFHEGFGNPFTQAVPHGTGSDADPYEASDVVYSMCMQCNTFCTIKVRLGDPGDSGATALVRKIAGNPYSALTTQPIGPIPYDTTPGDAVKGVGNMARDSRSMSGESPASRARRESRSPTTPSGSRRRCAASDRAARASGRRSPGTRRWRRS